MEIRGPGDMFMLPICTMSIIVIHACPNRLLIDKASGIYSGSVYNDRSLVPVLPGEITCDWSVSVVKAHPHTHAGEG